METGKFMRFTIEEVNAAPAEGWTFCYGWFPLQASHWAWFRREVRHG